MLAGGGPRAASLAERAARLRAASLRDGLIAAQLAAPVAAPGLAAALAHALRLPAGDAPDLPRRLFACLDDRELLLLIRGFEPREDAAALLGDILKRAPGVQILVTAARPLDVCGEWVVDVEG